MIIITFLFEWHQANPSEIVMLDKAKEQYYVPGRVVYSPYGTRPNQFYSYYHTMYDRIYTEGYFVNNTKYFWETNLYDLRTNQLLYSAQSQSFNPESAEKLGHEYGQMLVKDMVKENVLSVQKKGF